MNTKIAQLILTPGTKTGATGEIFVAQPDADKEALVGKLFALIEIESRKANNLKIVNFLIENINNNYYQNEKIILRERVKTVKVEHIFESALAKTNKNLAEFLRAEKIKLNQKLTNITIGVIYKNDLHFANTGNNKAFLIYKRSEELKKYDLADIVKQSEESDKKTQTNQNKFFSSVISGHIPRNGYFVFTNEALPEYLSGKRMVEIITTLPPAGAAEQIKNSLAKINHYVPFMALIIKNTAGYETEKIKKEIGGSTRFSGATGAAGKPAAGESVSDLNKMEEKTEELLAPRGLINFKKWSAAFAKFNFGTTFSGRQKKEIGAGALKDKIFFKKRTNLLRAKKAGMLFKNLVSHLADFAIRAISLSADKEKMINLAKKIKSIPAYANNKVRGTRRWFMKLDKKNKILLIIILGSALLLLQNLLSLHIKNNKMEEARLYADLTTPIEQKQNQIDASLLYGNEDRARELIGEVKKLIAALPRKTDEQIEKYEIFEKKLNEQLEKIRHSVRIEAAKELAMLSNLNANASPDNIILAPGRDRDKIYSGDSSQKTIYSINTADNLITAITGLSDEIQSLNYPAASKNENIYYFGGSNIIQLNGKTEEISVLNIKLPDNGQNIAAFDEYNNRLYLLDKQRNQIYRFNKTGSEFTGKTAWIKEKTDFSDAVSISIDGHIYVLRKNGELLKYLSGKKQDFKLDLIEPAIEEAVKVFVSPELKYIYILEPSKRRLAIFDKTGDFLMQYAADQFADLKDFTVDEQIKKIYFLDGSSVYEVEGAHFE